MLEPLLAAIAEEAYRIDGDQWLERSNVFDEYGKSVRNQAASTPLKKDQQVELLKQVACGSYAQPTPQDFREI